MNSTMEDLISKKSDVSTMAPTVWTDPLPVAPAGEAVAASSKHPAHWAWIVAGLLVMVVAIAGVVVAMALGFGGSFADPPPSQVLLDEVYAEVPDQDPVVEPGLSWEVAGGQLLLTPEAGAGWQTLTVDVPSKSDVEVQATFNETGAGQVSGYGVVLLDEEGTQTSGVTLACTTGATPVLIDGTGAVLWNVSETPCTPTTTLTLEVVGGSGPAAIIVSVNDEPSLMYMGDIEIAHTDLAGILMFSETPGYVVALDQWSVKTD